MLSQNTLMLDFRKIKEIIALDEILLGKVHTSKIDIDMLTKPVTAER